MAQFRPLVLNGGRLAELPTDATLIGATSPGSIPVGAIMPYMGGPAPGGWLLLNARQTIQRSDWPDLTAYVLDNGLTGAEVWEWGAGDGSTTLVTPDYTNYALMGGGGVVNVGAEIGSATRDTSHSHSAATTVDPAGEHDHTGATGADGGHDHGGVTGADGGHDHGGATGDSGTIQVGILGLLSDGAPGGHDHNIPAEPDHDHVIPSEGDHSHTIAYETDHTHTATTTVGPAGGVEGNHQPSLGIVWMVCGVAGSDVCDCWELVTADADTRTVTPTNPGMFADEDADSYTFDVVGDCFTDNPDYVEFAC